jgi:hypothetical protein
MQSNRDIEKFIGAPVDFYRPSASDRLHINIYNFFKPTILAFYEFINLRREPLIKTMMSNFFQYDPILLVNAARAGLIPLFGNFTPAQIEANPALKEEWINNWYNLMFRNVPEDRRLSLVVQGGEAINYYSYFKNDLVPTHDCDTRILAGNHFNYLQPIRTLPRDIKHLMHCYRFFTGFGLMITLKAFATQLMTQVVGPGPEYINKFFGSVANLRNLNLNFSIVSGGDDDYAQIIRDGQYDIDDDRNIDMLMAIEVNGFGIIDLFCPRKRRDSDLGHSDNLHSYFSTEQVESMDLVESMPNLQAGTIPYLDKEMNYGPNVVTFQGKIRYKLRIVPLGYLIWDTLRMLLYSRILERRRENSKFEKYKQKLNCLLATIMDTNISSAILTATDTKKAIDAPQGRFLAGGYLAVEKIGNRTKPITKFNNPLTIKMDTTSKAPTGQIALKPMKPRINKETEEALAISKKLFDMKDMDKEIPLESIKTPAEFAGYMNYLSHIEGGWSDFRIPNPNVKPVQIKPMTKEQLDNFMNMELKTGGKRKGRKGQKTRKMRSK